RHRCPILMEAPDVPEVRMSDNPSFVVKYEGIISAHVGRQDCFLNAPRQHTLAELHQVTVIDREDNNPVEFSFSIIERRRKADDPSVLFPALCMLGIRSVPELFLLPDMEPGKVRNMDLPLSQCCSFFEVIFTPEPGICWD